jgi:hypothetical protein
MYASFLPYFTAPHLTKWVITTPLYKTAEVYWLGFGRGGAAGRSEAINCKHSVRYYKVWGVTCVIHVFTEIRQQPMALANYEDVTTSSGLAF